MNLKKSVILALGVIIVLAVAAGLIVYNFRAAMFDRRGTAAEAPQAEAAVPAPEAIAQEEEEPTVLPAAAEIPEEPEAEEEITAPAAEPETVPEADAEETEVPSAIAALAPEEDEVAIVEETMAEDESTAITKEYDIYGHTLSASIKDGMVTLCYPDWVRNSDAEAFLEYEMERYNLGAEGISFSVTAPGTAAITLPGSIGTDEAEYGTDVLADDLIAYLAPEKPDESANEAIIVPPVPEKPAAEETPLPAAPAIVADPDTAITEEIALPSEPINDRAEEEDSPFEFTLFIKGGMLTGFDGAPLPEAGIGLDFKNILPIGDAAGIGLRSDISIALMPTIATIIDMQDGTFTATQSILCPVLGFWDLKLMVNADLGLADIFIGGGIGAAAGSEVSYTQAPSYLGYGPYSILGGEFRADWFASAIAGARFNITDLFSLGAEAGYRYMIGADRHTLSAAIAFGFSF